METAMGQTQPQTHPQTPTGEDRTATAVEEIRALSEGMKGLTAEEVFAIAQGGDSR